MMRFLLLGCLILMSNVLMSQVEVVADGRLQTILEQHISYNSMAKTFPGYRIKVAKFTGDNAKKQAFDLKKQLLEIRHRHFNAKKANDKKILRQC